MVIFGQMCVNHLICIIIMFDDISFVLYSFKDPEQSIQELLTSPCFCCDGSYYPLFFTAYFITLLLRLKYLILRQF